MKVLVIGDEHTYGYGLSPGQLSYIGHFIRQFSRVRRAVSVEAYAHLTMPQVLSTLDQLPLGRYDLIILQLDYTLLQPTRFGALSLPRTDGLRLPRLNVNQSIIAPPAGVRWLQYVRTALSTGLGMLLRPRRTSTALAALLNLLRPYRHTVLLLTPLPHRGTTSQWLHKQGRAALLRAADNQLFSVFDSDLVVRPREEYFLPNDNDHLNAVSHELLGRSLFDFYQSAPTIVTVQAIRRP